MRFSNPNPAYDDLRTTLFGTHQVPWTAEGTGGGTSPHDAAAEVLRHVADPNDTRLRLLVGDDAPGQVFAALETRRLDYQLDPRFSSVSLARSESPRADRLKRASTASRTGSLREPIPYRVAPRAHPVPGRSASPSRTGSLREP
ncbi:MAG: hypothetical protein WA966_14600, partial [Ornithinimicrobium sp.]